MSQAQPPRRAPESRLPEGREGRLPGLPLAVEDLERAAGSECTMLAKLEAFEKWRIVPRMLRGVSNRDPRNRVLNTDMPWSPVGMPHSRK